MAIINFNNEKWQLFRPSDRQANCHRCLISILILLCFAYRISFSGAEAILSFPWTEEMPGKFIDFAPRICFGIWLTFAYLFVSTFCSSRLLSVCVCVCVFPASYPPSALCDCWPRAGALRQSPEWAKKINDMQNLLLVLACVGVDITYIRFQKFICWYITIWPKSIGWKKSIWLSPL